VASVNMGLSFDAVKALVMKMHQDVAAHLANPK